MRGHAQRLYEAVGAFRLQESWGLS
jgi:hypothetical protein